MEKDRFYRYQLRPGRKFRPADWDPESKAGFDHRKGQGLKALQALSKKLEPLQGLLYAEHARSLLVVLQGMDGSGKDGTIKRVFEGVNPQGVKVAKFGPPTPEELDHDFLWRVHQRVPARGEIAIFNRSHYESVLVERVHKLVPRRVWRARYDQINDFERLLATDGTKVLKFYLNISGEEQKKRLQQRLEDPSKNWKFSARDIPERKLWSKYMAAYGDALERTSTRTAPWFVVPSNHPWFRDLVICREIVGALEDMRLQYPKLAGGEKPTRIQ